MSGADVCHKQHTNTIQIIKYMNPFHYNQDPLYSAAASILKGAKDTPENLQEAAAAKLVNADYIFFVQDRELYQNRPSYKRLYASTDFGRSEPTALFKEFDRYYWVAAMLATGEELQDDDTTRAIDPDTFGSWYEVDNAYRGNKSFALISKKY